MRAIIQPGSARGSVAAPPSKSMAHRLLICAGLADGVSVIRNVDRSEDILAEISGQTFPDLCSNTLFNLKGTSLPPHLEN